MFKKLDGITTHGLIDLKTSGKDLWDKTWNSHYIHSTHFSTYKMIIDNMYDDNYKHVDERLKQFIGVYELPIIFKPYWVDDFIEKFMQFITLENLLINKKFKPINDKTTCNDFYESMSDLTNKIKEANYIEGVLTLGEKRVVKIMKYIRQQLNKYVIISDEDFEKEDFVRYYIKMKETKNKLYIVLTNSIASLLGMSSYAPDVSVCVNDRKKLWTSCMSGHPNGTLTESVIANLTDKNSLICYVTNGIKAKNIMYPETTKYNHQAMITRTQVRMLEDTKTKQPILLVDRAYPNPMYTEQIYNLLAQLTKDTNFTLGMYANYNTHQSGTNYFATAHKKLTQNTIRTIGRTPNKILLPYACDCRSTNCKQNNCNLLNNTSKCYICKLHNDCKLKQKCYKCNAFTRDDSICGRMYYDDQVGSRTQSNGGSNITIEYQVYTGVEKNIRKDE